jgi:hypothetical protein
VTGGIAGLDIGEILTHRRTIEGLNWSVIVERVGDVPAILASKIPLDTLASMGKHQRISADEVALLVAFRPARD